MNSILRCCCIIVFMVLSIVRLSAQGFQWAHSAIADKTITDDTGNLYTLAWFNGTVDFDAGPNTYNLTAVGNNNMFVLKEDTAGNFLWVKQFGGPNGAQTEGIVSSGGIALDSDNNIYIAGNFKDSLDFDPSAVVNKLIGGAGNIFVLKLNGAGDLIWVKASNTTLPNFIWVNDMKLDASANLYLACNIQATVDVNFGPDTVNISSPANNITNTLVEKLDSAGNYIWAKNIAGPGNNYVSSIGFDASASVYFTGTFMNTVDFDPGITTYNLTSLGASLYGTDSYIAKWDSVGAHIWTKQIGGPDLEVTGWITVDRWGNPTVTGYLNGTADFDPSSSIYNLTSLNGTSGVTCHLNTNGDFKWANILEYAEPRSIACDTAGNVYMTGSFYGGDCDPGPSTFYLTSAGDQDVYVQKLDTAGNFKWAISMGGTGGDGAGWIDIDRQSNIYLSGGYSSPADFDPGPATFNLSGGNSFKLKLCPSFPVQLTASATTGCQYLDTITLNTPPIPGATYTWTRNGNDTVVQTGGSNTYSATQSGYYEVTVTGLGCPSTSNRVELEFERTLTPFIQSVSLGTGPTSRPCWVPFTIDGFGRYYPDDNWSSAPIPTPYHVVWLKNGVPYDTTYDIISSTYTPTTPGYDTITAVLTVDALLPCVKTIDESIVLIILPTDVEEIEGSAEFITIYPNPAANTFTTVHVKPGSRLLLCDLSGRTLRSWTTDSNQTTYDLTGLASGYYMLRVEDSKGRLIATKKMMKQ